MHPPAHPQDAQRNQIVESLRHTLILRMEAASGATQHEAASVAGISQAAVSRQLWREPLTSIRPEILLEAAIPILRSLAEKHGYRRLAVVGSLARGDARNDSDIDLLIEPPPGTSSFDFLRFKQLIERVIGREVDLLSYGGLRPGLDDDVLRAALLL